MKNREQLWEDYEEARFALLMDALAEAEGEEALRLSEALNRRGRSRRRWTGAVRRLSAGPLSKGGSTPPAGQPSGGSQKSWWRQCWGRSCSPPPSPSARTCGWPP